MRSIAVTEAHFRTSHLRRPPHLHPQWLWLVLVLIRTRVWMHYSAALFGLVSQRNLSGGTIWSHNHL